MPTHCHFKTVFLFFLLLYSFTLSKSIAYGFDWQRIVILEFLMCVFLPHCVIKIWVFKMIFDSWQIFHKYHQRKNVFLWIMWFPFVICNDNYFLRNIIQLCSYLNTNLCTSFSSLTLGLDTRSGWGIRRDKVEHLSKGVTVVRSTFWQLLTCTNVIFKPMNCWVW